MKPDTNKEKKQQLRNLLLEKRDYTSEDYLKIAARQILDALFASDEFTNASHIGVYHSVGSEIPTSDMISKMIDLDKSVYLPRVISDTAMVFGKVLSASKLQTSDFFTGILEPGPNAQITRHMDMILVPAIAASYDGCRLGYGRGYYDRYLAKHHDKKQNTTIIVPLLEKQVTKKIPMDRHDIKIDMIITEKRVIRCV